MTSFDDREKAQENKFAHEQELKFKALARAAKLFGEWAGAQIGVDKNAYATKLINLVTAGKDEKDLFKQVDEDARAKGKKLSKDIMEEKFGSCLVHAKEQIRA
jgi:hypothetical protein